MPEFIPNQPITFGATDQACLNNDQRAYAMLMQGEEEWKWQAENTPCDGDEGTVCDIDMNDLGTYQVNSEFTSLTEWDTLNDVNVFPTFGYAVLFVDAGSFNEAYMNRFIDTKTYCGDAKGKVYKLTWEVINQYIQGASVFYITADTLGACDDSVVLYQGYPFSGVQEQYVYIPADYTIFSMGLTGTDGDFVTMKSVSLQEVAPCWSTAMDVNTAGGCSTAESDKAWEYILWGGTGSFLANPGWDQWNAVVYPYNTLSVELIATVPNTEALLLEYTITGMTAGSIYPVLGGTAGAVRVSDGTYSEYLTAGADTTCLEFWTDADFDGQISIVSGLRYANCHTIDVVDAVTLTPVATGYVPSYVGTKIEMVFNPASIPGESGGVPNDFTLTDGCYRIQFNDCCTGESVISDTVINYTTGEHECTKLVNAYCDGQALGFDFSANFSLQHRLRTLQFNPTYRNEGEDSQGSNGVKRRPFAQSEKVYSCIFDYCDEPTHDAINAQLLCDTLEFDGVEYFYPIKDYAPDWAERGKLNLAQSQIEIQKKQSVIFNRNCI